MEKSIIVGKKIIENYVVILLHCRSKLIENYWFVEKNIVVFKIFTENIWLPFCYCVVEKNIILNTNLIEICFWHNLCI